MEAQSNQTMVNDMAFFLNYEGRQTQTIDHHNKLANLINRPDSFSNFQEFLRIFLDYSRTDSLKAACDPLPDELSIIVQKSSLLRTLRYFERVGCRNLKICFGLDACMVPQLVASGSFYCPNGESPTIHLLDNPYRKRIKNRRGNHVTTGHYVLNFGKQISVSTARAMLSRFKKAAAPSDLDGYALDIETFKLFLTDSQYLGQAERICIRMGMNNHGLNASEPVGRNSGRVRIMMLEFADDNEGVGQSFYMCNTSVKDDSDPGDCPPRQPCDATIS